MFTPVALETALGMTGIVLQNNVIIAGRGLPLDTANARLQSSLEAGKLPPDAEAFQVRAWMIRNNINLDTIATLIATAYPEGHQRQEALMRWEKAVRIPKDHPLVALVAAGLNVTVDSIWWDILAI